MRSMTSRIAYQVATEEAGQFAATVAAIVSRNAVADPWAPGAASSDADPALDQALHEAGWDELGYHAELLPLVAPAAAALGRGFTSLTPVDALIGGVLKVGSLVRYPLDNALLIEPLDGRLRAARGGELSPVPYTDALGVAHAELQAAGLAPIDPDEAGTRMAAWVAASTGYLAGLSEEALRLALEHARSRRAFGGPLSALEPVQQMLADAATLVDGLSLLTSECPGADALAHAGDAAERAVSICMQVTGALGFTLEFPLQRAYRRSRSARAWADAVLEAWDRGEAEVRP
jgi:3-oxo-4-pregnene-20-carboxyl-CoA dehydrogenase alpha subunit